MIHNFYRTRTRLKISVGLCDHTCTVISHYQIKVKLTFNFSIFEKSLHFVEAMIKLSIVLCWTWVGLEPCAFPVKP